MSLPLGSDAVPPEAVSDRAADPQAAMKRPTSCFMAFLVAKNTGTVKTDLAQGDRIGTKRNPSPK
jgi:hypothetical protein